MNRFTLMLALTSAGALAGCNTVESYKPKMQDGRETIVGLPVIGTGTLVDITAVERRSGKVVSSAARATGDVVGDAGITGAGLQATGLSSLQGGAAVGGALAILDVISALNSPQIVAHVRTDNGSIETAPLNQDTLQQTIRNNCVEIGDKVRVAMRGRSALLYQSDYRLVRLNDFGPSCRELRTQYLN